MSKSIEQIASEYAETIWDQSELAVEDMAPESHVAIGKEGTKIGFVAGYKAARAIVEEELKLINANKSFSFVIRRPCVESAILNILEKIGDV